jgi:hypothetical protein
VASEAHTHSHEFVELQIYVGSDDTTLTQWNTKRKAVLEKLLINSANTRRNCSKPSHASNYKNISQLEDFRV